jgi:hypothetical protein
MANPAGPEAPLPQAPTNNSSPNGTMQPVPILVIPSAGSKPSSVAAAQTWLTNLVAAYNALASFVAIMQKNLGSDTSSWNTDASNLGGVVQALLDEQPTQSWITNDLIDSIKTGQSDILGAVLLTGQAQQAGALVGATALMAIPTQAPAVAALLDQLSQSSAIVQTTSVAAPGTVKKSTAVVAGVGSAAAGAIAGGLLGHAIGSGLLFAGEAREPRPQQPEMAAESRRRKRTKKRTR